MSNITAESGVSDTPENQSEKYINPKIGKFTPYTLPHDFDGIDIRLDANESFYPLPDEILEECIKSIKFNRYPDMTAGRLIRAYGLYHGINPEYITAGNGSDELISIIVNAFLSKGDKIITFAPDFSMYSFYSELAEADVVTIPKEDDLKIDLDRDDLWSSVADARLVMFSNPCNPTGQLVKKDKLTEFISKCPCLVVIDEAYMDFTDGSNSLLNDEDIEKYPNLIILKTLSKSIGAAALRVGFAVANTRFTGILQTVKSPYNVNSLSQSIAASLLSDSALLEERRLQIIQNKKMLYNDLLDIFGSFAKVYQTETNFVLIQTGEAREIYDYLYNKRILVRIIQNKYLRITTGSEYENKTLTENLKEYKSWRRQ